MGRLTKNEMIYNNCESNQTGAIKIPNECLWCERWPVWGYVGAELAQSSYYYSLDVLHNRKRVLSGKFPKIV